MSAISESEFRKSPILREIVRRLIDAYQPERVYLFGSKARNAKATEGAIN
jgi:predicted nucleotidyltransferase